MSTQLNRNSCVLPRCEAASQETEIDFGFECFYLRGVGGVENVQLGVAFDFAKGHAQNFRAQAGAAHAEQKCVLEACFFYVGGNFVKRGPCSRFLSPPGSVRAGN